MSTTPSSVPLMTGICVLYYCLRYNLKEGLSEIRLLPPVLRDSAWALTELAHCYYHINAYSLCVKAFARRRRLWPWVLQGSELHATALYNLGREVCLALSTLYLHSHSLHSFFAPLLIAGGTVAVGKSNNGNRRPFFSSLVRGCKCLCCEEGP